VIRTASAGDLPALRELFARANDAPYDLGAVTEEKCFGRGISGEPVVRVIERGGVAAGAAVTCGKWLRILIVDRAARRAGLGSALLRDAESRGVTVIAAEPGNYFTPGILTSDSGSLAFFRARGYVETATTDNLDAGLETIALDAPGVFRPKHDDAERVLDFIERDFGRIWRFEASHAFERDTPTIYVTEHDGAIAGFAAHDVNNRGLGWFGPTGVSQSLRGRGIGRSLLLASLADLRRLGYSRAVIPWTDALDFYRKSCGAEPAHRFVTMSR
jgi:GNAT superfamily N-acetyltransferase